MSWYRSLVSRAQDSPSMLDYTGGTAGHRPAKILFSLSLDWVLYLTIPSHCLGQVSMGTTKTSLESLVLSILCRRERRGSYPL